MKRFFLLLFFVTAAVSLQGAVVAGDFDGDERVTLKDIAYALAFYLYVDATLSTLPSYSSSFYNKATGPVVRLPGAADSFDSKEGFGLGDISVMLAFYLSVEPDFEKIGASANSFFDRTGQIYKLPETPIGDSTVPVTITGIQVDNP